MEGLGRSSARVVPVRPAIGQIKTTSYKERKDASLAESASVSSNDGKPRKLVVLGELKSKSRLQGSGSSVATEHTIAPFIKKWRAIQVKILRFVESKPVTIVMTIATIYALFGDDARASSAPVSADYTFYDMSFVVMCLYTIELFLNCISKPNYIWGFYFWLDFISTASLLVDVGWCVIRLNFIFHAFNPFNSFKPASLAKHVYGCWCTGLSNARESRDSDLQWHMSFHLVQCCALASCGLTLL